MKDSTLKKMQYILLILLLLLPASLIYSQTNQVKGKVTDENGAGLPEYLYRQKELLLVPALMQTVTFH